MQEYQKECKKNNICAEKEQTTAARTKQHEDKEGDTGTWPAGKKKNETNETRQKRTKQASKTASAIATDFALPPMNLTKTNKNYYSL